MYSTKTTCRLCNGSFEDVLSLGEIYISGFTVEKDKIQEKAPLDLVRCIDCNLYQLRHTLDQDTMYREYWYQSGLNGSMVEALQNVVDCALQRVNIEPEDVVIDIGANDGTLLGVYDRNLFRIAFEPSNIGTRIPSSHANLIIHDYFAAESIKAFNLPKAKIITAIAMFYDLENPHTFLEDVRSILHKEGIFIIQMMDLRSMFESCDFPNMCSEHLEYYSLEVLHNLLLQHDLHIFDLEYNRINGGSLRVYVKHNNNFSVNSKVERALGEERAYFESLGNPAHYIKTKAEGIKSTLVNFIQHLVNCGFRVAILGASTKGNTLLQYCGLTEKQLDHAAEVNCDKFGKRTVGSNIPIISEKESLTRNPDYYLILSYGFTDFFVKKFTSYLEQGGMLISPLPEPRVIYMEDVTDKIVEDDLRDFDSTNKS